MAGDSDRRGLQQALGDWLLAEAAVLISAASYKSCHPPND